MQPTRNPPDPNRKSSSAGETWKRIETCGDFETARGRRNRLMLLGYGVSMRSLLATASAFVLVAVVPMAQASAQGFFDRRQLIQPNSYTSADGHWKLDVDPTRSNGAGPAKYQIALDGKVTWHGELPFTLFQSAVAPDGTFVGYSFTTGSDQMDGDCVLVTVGHDGKVRGTVQIKRGGAPFPDGPAEPIVGGIAIAGEQTWWTANIRDDRRSQEFEYFPRIALATGTAIDELEVPRSREKPDGSYSVLSWAAPLDREPLILVHRITYNWTTRKTEGNGALFELIDLHDNVVWSLPLDADYGPEDENGGNEMTDRARSGHAMIVSTEPGRFAVIREKAHCRIEFAATREGDVWKVRELSRSPAELPPLERPFDREHLPSIELAPLGSIELAASRAASDAVRFVHAFGFNSSGQLMIACDVGDSRKPECRLATSEGAVFERVPVELPKDLGEGMTKFAPFPDGRWLVTHSAYGPDKPTSAWWFDPKKSELTALENWHESGEPHIAPIGKGDFVALMEVRHEYTQSSSLLRCDNTGKPIWRIDGDGGFGGKDSDFLGPDDVAVATSGEIVLVDAVRVTLQLFDGEGKFLRLVSLKPLYSNDVPYTSDIRAHPKGGVIVGSQSDKPLLHCDLDGKELDSLAPKRISGNEENASLEPPMSSDFAVGPDARIWCLDGERIARLDAHGVPDRVVGDTPSVDALNSPSDAWIDREGRIIVLDYDTKALHIFGRDGARAAVARITSNEIGRVRGFGERVAVGAKDELWLALNDGWARFDRQGVSLGDFAARAGSDLPLADGRAWLDRDGTLVLVDASGKALAEHRRRADGKWFDSIDFGGLQSTSGDELAFADGRTLCFYGADSSEHGTIELPRGWYGRVALSPHWIARSGSDASVVLVKRDGHTAVEFKPKGIDAKSSCSVGFSPDGNELWVVAIEARKLWRYRLA